jgi:type II secretion system protein I
VSARYTAARGFTLIEVVVALAIVALGISAALTTLSSAADNTARLRDKSCAQWIGLNQIAAARLNLQAPAAGTTHDELDFANAHWYWQQLVEESEALPGVQKLTLKVKRTGALGSKAGSAAEADEHWLTTVVGFRGSAISAASGEQPDWNGQPAGGGKPGSGGPGPGGPT